MPQKNKALNLILSNVKDRLSRAGVLWVVFAGVAAHAYGSKRKAADIDILVKNADLKKAETALKDVKGVDVVGDLEIDTNDGKCLFFMDDEMIERTHHKKLFAVAIPVIPVEDSIVFKAILQRSEDKGKHDIQDIQQMATHEKIDLKYLQRRIEKYHAEKRVKPLLEYLHIL